MKLEQGLTLHELPGTKISLKSKAQGYSGGKQTQPTAGAAGRDAAPPSSEFSDGDERKQGG